jgi:hypothetical protein
VRIARKWRIERKKASGRHARANERQELLAQKQRRISAPMVGSVHHHQIVGALGDISQELAPVTDMQPDARIVYHPLLLWIITHKLQVTWVDLDDINLLHTRKTTDEESTNRGSESVDEIQATGGETDVFRSGNEFRDEHRQWRTHRAGRNDENNESQDDKVRQRIGGKKGTDTVNRIETEYPEDCDRELDQ